MRYAIAIVAAALWAGNALADEPAACYMASDPTGDFVASNMQSFDADPRTGAQIRHLLNESNRAIARCIRKHVEREGWPSGAHILYGMRISPAGKLNQVSVLAADNINDATLMACIGRTICIWELEPSADGQERLVKLPPVKLQQEAWLADPRRR